MRDPAARPLTILGRGFCRRCGRCGGGNLFPGLLTMVENCPRCGHHFERDQGYWIGAMIVATGFTLTGFLTVFIGGLVITWPDVPWNLLLVSAVAVTAIVPVVSYPTARTLWIAMDLCVRPLEDEEISTALRNSSG